MAQISDGMAGCMETAIETLFKQFTKYISKQEVYKRRVTAKWSSIPSVRQPTQQEPTIFPLASFWASDKGTPAHTQSQKYSSSSRIAVQTHPMGSSSFVYWSRYCSLNHTQFGVISMTIQVLHVHRSLLSFYLGIFSTIGGHHTAEFDIVR